MQANKRAHRSLSSRR